MATGKGPSVWCYEQPSTNEKSIRDIEEKERKKEKDKRRTREIPLTGGLPVMRAADEGSGCRNPSPTRTGLTSSLEMIGEKPKGNGETIYSLLRFLDGHICPTTRAT